MKKRFLSVMMAIIMVIMCCNSVGVGAADNEEPIPTITVSSVDATAGESVSVTVSLSNNPGICSARLALSYDSRLTLTAVNDEGLINDYVFGKSLTANPYYMTWDDSLASNDTTTNGNLVTLTFKVSDTAVAGDYPISISYKFGEIYNLDLTDIDFTVINGKITVKSSSVAVSGITLDKTSESVKTSETVQLTATVSPANATDKTIVWSSSDKTIATVDTNGLVTAVKSGSVTIYAKTPDGSVQATCTITIDCAHTNKTHYAATDSTCVKQGNDEYYVCDDCGQILAADTTTELEATPFRPLGEHKGGTATCKEKVICTVCGNSYGDFAEHNYSAQSKTQETLKTAGTCKAEAIYYYSCSVCGLCEHNDTHTIFRS